MNKCHSNLNWLNDTTPAINDTNLNYMDGCIDTIDSRVVTMDSTKLEAGNIATVIKNVSVNDSTGVFTFTRYDNSTFTVDTMLEKVVTNFGFDETTQKLTITLEDGTTKQVDLSSFIKETEVADTDTVALSLVNHKLTATVKGNSIGDAQMQTQYLADCQSAKNTASSAATSSNTTRLQSEGYALGTQDSVPVGSDSIYYHNNAKWYKDQAQAIASSTLGGLSDVTITSPSEGQSLVYDSETATWVNGDATVEIVNNLTSTATDKALSANMGKTLNDKVSTFSNENLLDNPWFTVNQRGASGNVSSAYGCDRWFGSYKITTPYLEFEAGNVAIQHLSDEVKNELDGKIVTLSVKFNDDTIKSGTITYSKNSSSRINAITDSLIVQIGSTSDIGAIGSIILYSQADCSIKAVKLELGAISTLLRDAAPNHAIELVKCQRYYIGQIKTFGIATNNTFAFTTFQWNMRSAPSISSLQVIDKDGAFYDCTLHEVTNNGCHLFYANSSNFITGQAYRIIANGISADL